MTLEMKANNRILEAVRKRYGHVRMAVQTDQ